MLSSMKDFYVADAAKFDGETVISFFAISSFSVREKKGGGGQYLALTLSDKTGSMEARMWEEFASAMSTCGEGCYVKVQGQISKYQGKFQITLSKMRLAANSEIEVADFVPTTKYDVAEMWAELREHVEAFSNADLKRLVLAFLDDERIGVAYREAPAAKMLHHAWIGGLLEHVVALVRVCKATAPFYPEVDPDLLVTGAILHDIGKVRELMWGSSFSYTLEGQLIGHISIAQGMLREKVATLPGFSEKLLMLVEHMILSHHGKYEFGSPKLPMTPEALLLSTLDDLEAKMQAVRNEFARDAAAGKTGSEMTEWVRSMDRQFLNTKGLLAADRPRDPSNPD
jgi:3'-5' exoribonuclease